MLAAQPLPRLRSLSRTPLAPPSSSIPSPSSRPQLQEVNEASAKDDDQDKDGDGVADVDQISPDELLKRKITIAMMAIKEPNTVQTAIGSLWSAYLAVLATLKLQFARTTAIALGIADMVKFPITRALAPLLSQGLGKDLGHWAKCGSWLRTGDHDRTNSGGHSEAVG